MIPRVNTYHSFQGGVAKGSKGYFSILLRLIKCNAMYYQEVISSFMTENSREAIKLLLLGGVVEHEEEVTLGHLGESIVEGGVLWAVDESVTLLINSLLTPVAGAGVILQVATLTVTAAEVVEVAFIESLRGRYYLRKIFIVIIAVMLVLPISFLVSITLQLNMTITKVDLLVELQLTVTRQLITVI